MLEKLISAMLISTIVVGTLPIITASASGKDPENNAVHGYVAASGTEGGFELVSSRKTPVIHVDENDYESVLLAADNLSEDIESVTDKKPIIKNSDIIISEEGAGKINISGNNMTVLLKTPVISDAQCFVAAYNSDGSLSNVAKSSEVLNDSEAGKVIGFKFDKAVKRPGGGEIKAFIWDEQMKPLLMFSQYRTKV